MLSCKIFVNLCVYYIHNYKGFRQAYYFSCRVYTSVKVRNNFFGTLSMSRVMLVGSIGTLALISIAFGYFYLAVSLVAGLGIFAYLWTPRKRQKVDPKGKAVFITGMLLTLFNSKVQYFESY